MTKATVKIFILFYFLTTLCGVVEARVRFITDDYGDEPHISYPQSKSCESYNLLSSVPEGQTCTKVTKENNICYSDCKKPYNSCEEAGYSNYVPIGSTCVEVKVGENICYKDCNNVCEVQGYLSNIIEGKNCDLVYIEGTPCYNNCKEATCSDGNLLSKPVNTMQCNEYIYMGKTCYKCFEYEEICNRAGYMHYVPEGQKCTEITYLGTKCYQDCVKVTCKDIGYYDSEQEDKICYRKVINETYNNCYECRSYRCSDGGYSGLPTAGKTCSKVSYKGLTCFDLSTCL